MRVIIDTWHFQTNESQTEVVIPDGCNDVILKTRNGGSPSWMVSVLQDGCLKTELVAGSQLFGFRILPGTRIQEDALLAKLYASKANELDASQIIQDYCSQHQYIDEALQTLSSFEITVSVAAQRLTVNQRALQRLVRKETGKTPMFWIRLAKVRRTARDVLLGMPLGDCAFNNGYADQAHMSREIKHWLGTTPSKLPEQTSIEQQLSAIAYA